MARTMTRIPPAVWIGVSVSLLAGAIFGLPHIVIPLVQDEGTSYAPLVVRGVSLLTFEETMNFGAEIRETLDGRWPVHDPSTWEHKTEPANLPLLPALVGAGLALAAGSIPNAFVLADFLLPALTVAAGFTLLYQLTRHALWSAIGPLAIVLGTEVLQRFPAWNANGWRWIGRLIAIDGTESVPLSFSRFPFPELSVLFIVLPALLILIALERNNRIWTNAAGVGVGAAIWTYLYSWTFLVAGMAFLLLMAVIQRDKTVLRRLATIVLIGVIVGLPVWIQAISFAASQNRNDILERVGLELGHFRNVNRTIQYLLFGLAAAAALRFRLSRPLRYFFAFLAGGILCLQLQLVTGVTFQSWHWAIRALNPWMFLLAAGAGFELTRHFRKRKFVNAGLAVLLLALLGWGFAYQTAYARNVAAAHQLPNETTELFAWLNENAERDAVVGSISMETNALIPTYTHQNVLVPFGAQTTAPTDEIIDRLFVLFRMYGKTEADVQDWFAFDADRHATEDAVCAGERCGLDWSVKDENATEHLTVFKYLQVKEGLFSYQSGIAMPESEVQRIVERFRSFSSEPTRYLRSFRLDYVVAGTNEARHGSAATNAEPFLEEVFRSGATALFRVKPR